MPASTREKYSVKKTAFRKFEKLIKKIKNNENGVNF